MHTRATKLNRLEASTKLFAVVHRENRESAQLAGRIMDVFYYYEELEDL
jgi:hypothetical protein